MYMTKLHPLENLTFTMHESLAPFESVQLAYLRKGLDAMVRHVEPSYTKKERYAAEVYSRLEDMDRSKTGLQTALSAISKLLEDPVIDIKAFVYHYENMVMRSEGFLDRSFRLVGAALRMDPKDFDALGGNTRVFKQCTRYKDVKHALREMKDITSVFTPTRHHYTHAGGFSNKLLAVCHASREIPEFYDKYADAAEKLLRDYVVQTLKTLQELLNAVLDDTELLFIALKTVYSDTLRTLVRKRKKVRETTRAPSSAQ